MINAKVKIFTRHRHAGEREGRDKDKIHIRSITLLRMSYKDDIIEKLEDLLK